MDLLRAERYMALGEILDWLDDLDRRFGRGLRFANSMARIDRAFILLEFMERGGNW